MKIVYYSGLPFADCDFPLLKEYQKNNKVFYFIPLLCNRLNGALVSIKKQIQKAGVFKALSYKEFETYERYIDLSDTYVVNRTQRGMTISTFVLYFKMVIKLFKINPDIIHITHPLWGPEMMLYLFCRKMIITVHDPFLHTGETGGTKELQRKIAFRLVKKVLLLNSAQKEQFILHYSLKKEKVFVSKLGVYDCLNAVRPPVNTVQSPYILFFGRFSKYKGIEYLCEAMQLVHDEIPQLHCVIAGGGKIYFDYSKYSKDDFIILKNEYIDTDRLISLLNGSLFSVCPYTDATQSGVIYSSFALKKPVVASNVGALSDAVIDGETGLLVSPKNPKALADAIINLAKNEEQLKQMSDNIEKMFFQGSNSWKAIAENNINIYKA